MAITKYMRRRPMYSGWRDLEAMSNRMSRFFDVVPFSADSVGWGWAPHVDVIESDEELTLTAELPGLLENDITITLENSVLSISGDKNAIRDEILRAIKDHGLKILDRDLDPALGAAQLALEAGLSNRQ